MLAALIFYASLFLTCVIAPVALILFALLLLDHERRLWLRVTPVAGPIGGKLAKMPVVLDLLKRFPRTTVFLRHRIAPHDPWGLPATIAALGILFGLWFFIGVLEDIAAKDPLVTLDLRLHNTVPLFRTAGMTGLMLVLTNLGSTTVLSMMCLGIALLALARGQRRLAATFILALAGTGLVSTLFKTLFGYGRPSDALISVHEASFPSGHLLSGAVVYGLLAAVLLSSQVQRRLRALGMTLLLLLIVGIGLSRLYLGVHWPSDLLGSLALALMLIPALLFFLHYDHPVRWIDTIRVPLSARAMNLAGGILLVLVPGVAAVLARQTELIPIAPPYALRPIDAVVLTTTFPLDLPRRSEDLIGGQMEPISLVLIGSEYDLVSAFTRAGWMRADLPTPVRVVEEALAALGNRPDLSGPATPAYVADRPQAITFEKPDANSPTIRHRHHTRLWQTHYCVTPGCRPVWVATASYDVGVGISPRIHLPTHRIDPAIDTERALVVADLTGAGATQEGVVTVLPPLRGTNAAGDPFATDGRAAVLVLP